MKVPIMMNDKCVGCDMRKWGYCTLHEEYSTMVRCATLPDVMKDSPQADKIREEYKCQTGVE